MSTENNKLIAEFMGASFNDKGMTRICGKFGLERVSALNLRYHTSWDWLMPVVKKIVSDVELDIDYEDEYREHLMDVVHFAKIEDVYEAVVEFIKELNK